MKKNHGTSLISRSENNQHKQSSNAQVSMSTDKKHKYLLFLKEQQQLQRQKVKEQIHKKLVHQKKQKQEKLKHELETKKKQLQQLQMQKPDDQGHYHRGFELAKVKEQNDSIKKELKLVQEEANNTKSEFRYLQAMKWLEKQNEDRNQFIKVAMQRRKTVQETEKVERGKAIQYKKHQQYLENSKKPEEIVPFTQYKQPLGRSAYAKNYSVSSEKKSNPILIVKQKNQVPKQAEALAQGQHALRRAQSIKKQCEFARNQKIANERYKQALLKMKRQRQLQEYQLQAQKTGKQYNLSRVHAGKKNQYAGLKPATMSQIRANKTVRSEQQFERTFLHKNNPEFKANRIANNYEIAQARNKLQQFNEQSRARKQGTQKKERVKKNTSVINQMSEGKYSFDSENKVFRTKTQSNQQAQHQQIAERNEEEQISHDQIQAMEKHNMYELTPQVIKQYRKHKQATQTKAKDLKATKVPDTKTTKDMKDTRATQQFSFKPNMNNKNMPLIQDIVNTKKLQKTNIELSNVCQNRYQYEDQQSQDSQA